MLPIAHDHEEVERTSDNLVLGLLCPLRSLSFHRHIHLYPVYKNFCRLVKKKQCQIYESAFIPAMNYREFPLCILNKSYLFLHSGTRFHLR
jgi:hypothetical protein